jgi:hypothetical protein
MEDMLYLYIEKMFGLTNGCRTLGRICCRLTPMTLVRSIEEAGDHLKERKDRLSVTVSEDQDILLRNALEKDLVVFVVKL